MFYRKFQITKKLLNMPNEELKNLPSTDFYDDFWTLASESIRPSKFSEEENSISQEIRAQMKQEQSTVRRQYLALILILFGELVEVQDVIEQQYWAQKVRDNFVDFLKWNSFANTSMPLKTRTLIFGIAKGEHYAASSLYEKYSELINKHSQDVINEENCPPVQDYQIYFCWLQGEENLPTMVRCCYNSLKQNAGHYKIVFIDEKNFSNYVDIAPHIMDKFKAEKISRTHFSDILRISLLERHGGLWLDSTVLVTEPLEKYKNLLEKPYFSQRWYKNKSYKNHITGISFGRWASFVQGTSILHNPLFVFIKEFFEDYLCDFDSFQIYFLQDFAIKLAYDNIPSVKKIFDDVPPNNPEVHSIRGHMHDSYPDSSLDKFFAETFLHKTGWKNNWDIKREGTLFREILRRYAPEIIKS